jgi:hypothetical protein
VVWGGGMVGGMEQPDKDTVTLHVDSLLNQGMSDQQILLLGMMLIAEVGRYCEDMADRMEGDE